MDEIQDYAPLADDNDAPAPAGAPEGMPPGGVNDAMREHMARSRRWYDRINGGVPRGHIAGLTLSNNGSDANNDIDIAVGEATAVDQSAIIVLGSALTKRLDASWAVGTNQGMLDGSESVAGTPDTSTWYHIFLIRRSDTGVVDVLASESATAPTMPTNYDQKRRIWSVFNDGSGNIRAFKQDGDIALWSVTITDRNDTAAVASALLALSVPTGIAVRPILQVTQLITTSVNVSVALGSAAEGSANHQVLQAVCGAGDSNEYQHVHIPGTFTTNTSAQIYHSQTNNAGTPTTSNIRTFGYIDRRGRDD